MKTAQPKILIPLVCTLALSILAACGKGAETSKDGTGNQTIPVVVVPVTQKNVPRMIRSMGHAESCHLIAIKSRVDGEIFKVHIVDGQDVRHGTPLFDLDDRPFQHSLKQLQANLERDLALLENARTKEQRQITLNKQSMTSEENLTTQVTSRQAAAATVAADRAAIAEGELQLAFTRIVAPISGVAGHILVHSGNLVKANDANPLVVINQVDPICITFAVSEQYLAPIRANHAKTPLTLQVYPNREQEQPIAATLLAMDNTVDRQTATIGLKAQATNPDRRLWPGMFVTLALKLADRPDALVIPSQAVQTGSKGPFVYVVKSDQTVEVRPLTLAQEDQEESVVTTGLGVGEVVVTVGQWRLKAGTQVEIIPQAKDEKKS